MKCEKCGKTYPSNYYFVTESTCRYCYNEFQNEKKQQDDVSNASQTREGSQHQSASIILFTCGFLGLLYCISADPIGYLGGRAGTWQNYLVNNWKVHITNSANYAVFVNQYTISALAVMVFAYFLGTLKRLWLIVAISIASIAFYPFYPAYMKIIIVLCVLALIVLFILNWRQKT